MRTCCRLLSGAAVAMVGCAGPTSALEPAGPSAARIAELWWLMLGLSTVLFLATMAFLWFALTRRREEPGTSSRIGEKTIALVGGAAIPAVVLLFLLVVTVRTSSAIVAPAAQSNLTIDVYGHMFWWEIAYPDHDVVTANELHIPAGRPVQLRLHAADVIHSFSVPRLHGKMDLVPGQVNTTWLQADSPGVYRGVCAEFCGEQHALMQFLVVAQTDDQFANWLAQQQRLADDPVDPAARRGLELFASAGCVQCHVVRGANLPDVSDPAGPDLTHLASRQTLGAAVLENNPEILAAFVRDPHDLKPGLRMPPTNLSPEDLAALVAYLEGLE